MPKAYIIHGWTETPESAFFPWMKEELEKRGYDVAIPLLPNTNVPLVDEWIDFLMELFADRD